MPILSVERGEIYYQVSGRGFPVLLFAPGFLGSRIERWRRHPAARGRSPQWRNPIPALARDFKVIALDVRNAGRSWSEIGPDYDWPCYTADHLALLDEVGAERCHVMGTCIGASFAMAEMMVFLAVLLQRLDVSADPSMIPVPGARLTLRPQAGMRLTLTPRS